MIIKKNIILQIALIYSFIYILGPPLFMGGYGSWTGWIWIIMQVLIIVIYSREFVQSVNLNDEQHMKILMEFGIVIIACVVIWYWGALLLQYVYN